MKKVFTKNLIKRKLDFLEEDVLELKQYVDIK